MFSGDGWAPLCSFLGFQVPRVPYPQTNSREELRKIIRDYLWHQYYVVACVTAWVFIFAAVAYYFYLGSLV